MPGELMAQEIDEQPTALARLLDLGTAPAAEARAAILRAAPRFVILAARGTSDHAALYGKYLTEVHLQLPAGLASPSAFTVYGARPDMRDVLFLAVSQSGGSPDLVESTEVARACGALTVAVTNNADSALAAAAAHHVPVHAGPERAVAATKTYTAELLALYLLLVGGGTRRRCRTPPPARSRMRTRHTTRRAGSPRSTGSSPPRAGTPIPPRARARSS